MYKKIIVLLLFTMTMQGMKQQKLIKKIIEHPRGVFLINAVLEGCKKRAKALNGSFPEIKIFFGEGDISIMTSKTLPFLIKKNSATIHHDLSFPAYDHSVMRECGSMTPASLIFPCPDTFMETIKPLIWSDKEGEIYIDQAAVAESERHQQNQSEGERRKSTHPLYCWEQQLQIIKNMTNDSRRFITFYKMATKLKASLWNETNRIDHSMLHKWGATDLLSIIEPDNQLYDFYVKTDHFLLNVPVKDDNKALMETAQMCPTHGEFCYNPGQAVVLAQQQEKDRQDYATILKKASWLFLHAIRCEYETTLENATLLEECGFYGISGLKARNPLEYSHGSACFWGPGVGED